MIRALLPAPTSRSAGDPPYQPFLRNSWAAAAFRCGAGRRRDSSKAPPIVVVGPPHRHFSGLDRSMRDRGERGTVPNKLHGESRAWVHDSAAPSPGPRVWKGAFRSTIDLTCLPSLCRAGDIRSRPPAAKRGRGTRPPLPDGAGLAPWRQAGHDVGDTHSPNPRFLPKLHSMPPASRMMPVICWPMRLSSTGCHGTS